MIFQGVETDPYQDPVDAVAIKEGDVCYCVSLDGNTPLINSVYFIGRNLDADDFQGEEMFYFQDSISYFAGIRYGSNETPFEIPTTFLKQPVGNLNGIYTLEAALQILMYYSAKRKK